MTDQDLMLVYRQGSTDAFEELLAGDLRGRDGGRIGPTTVLLAAALAWPLRAVWRRRLLVFPRRSSL
jgi:hypothetical protein